MDEHDKIFDGNWATVCHFEVHCDSFLLYTIFQITELYYMMVCRRSYGTANGVTSMENGNAKESGADVSSTLVYRVSNV